MYEAHDQIHTPPDNTIVWRYMNLEKLLALLCSRGLYLCRLDRFRDPWEGHWTKPAIEAMRTLIEEANKALNKALHESVPITLMEEIFDKMPTAMFVNCWHENGYESAALWDQYATVSGLAIKSTVGRLKRGCHSEQSYYIGQVNYLDYQRDAPKMMDPLNSMTPVFIKRKSFEHEREVRLLIHRLPMYEDKLDWTRAPESHTLPVDLAILIESIYLSPESPIWLQDAVTELLRRFDLASIPVNRSDLYDLRLR
jgi:hypothetical protein